MIHPTSRTPQPRIGVSTSDAEGSTATAMCVQLRNAGALPVILNHDISTLKSQLSTLDGIVVMGSTLDIDPKDYGQEKHPETILPEAGTSTYDAYHKRMSFDPLLVQKAIEFNMPLLGVCAGMQRINITADATDSTLKSGTLIQHLEENEGFSNIQTHQYEGKDIQFFTPVHFVKIMDGTTFSNIAQRQSGWFNPVEANLPEGVYLENSYHHQAIDKVRDGFRIAAIAPDGVIEAIENDPNGIYKDHFILGVQFHPEYSASTLGTKIAGRLTEEATQYAAKQNRDHDVIDSDRPEYINAILKTGRQSIEGLFTDAVARLSETSFTPVGLQK